MLASSRLKSSLLPACHRAPRGSRLSSGEHVLRCHIADRAVQTDRVVIHVGLVQGPRIFQGSSVNGWIHSDFSDVSSQGGNRPALISVFSDRFGQNPPLVPHVMRHPVLVRAPRTFIKATSSAINSAKTWSLVCTSFSKNSIRPLCRPADGWGVTWFGKRQLRSPLLPEIEHRLCKFSSSHSVETANLSQKAPSQGGYFFFGSVMFTLVSHTLSRISNRRTFCPFPAEAGHCIAPSAPAASERTTYSGRSSIKEPRFLTRANTLVPLQKPKLC